MGIGKIINDPVYGFIRIPEKPLLKIIDHPYFQRLRRIRQMGMAQYVYPGAVHTRFHHSLGAMHLMDLALKELKLKEQEISAREVLAVKAAILMHDIGHGPFSHALEHTIVNGVHHEQISQILMEQICSDIKGIPDIMLDIFEGKYEKTFLHQLVSSQLDMDRLDYLNRDSFYTGVSEGVIGYDRILQMLTIHNGHLAIEEKGVHSVEKFIIARRLMYWQVYLHKTVLGAEKLIINILKKAKELALNNVPLFASPSLQLFLYEQIGMDDLKGAVLNHFCLLDDSDIISAIKAWTMHDDSILAKLCNMWVNRRLYKVKMSTNELTEMYLSFKKIGYDSGILNDENCDYLLFQGTTSNDMYNEQDEKILISMKDGALVDILDVDNSLITKDLSHKVVKNYLCVTPELYKLKP